MDIKVGEVYILNENIKNLQRDDGTPVAAVSAGCECTVVEYSKEKAPYVTIDIEGIRIRTEDHMLDELPMHAWMRREIEIASKSTDEYGKAVFNSAAKAYMSLMTDGHSGMSIGITKCVLNRLIDRKPLSPLTGEDDEWEASWTNSDLGFKTYHNKRYSALFKYVYEDGTVRYSDVDQFVCFNINSPDVPYHNGFISRTLEPFDPIVFPYAPRDKAIEVYTEDVLSDPANGDFDTMAILYMVRDDDKIDINKFYKETEDSFIEISKEEYMDRKRMHVAREENRYATEVQMS